MNVGGSLSGSASFTNDGVATVWLLATLGGINSGVKNNNEGGGKKLIRRKDILDVSIPETCEAINNSHMALPLRHISSLLYGVTLCYNKKTEFFMNDLTTVLSQLNRSARQSLQVKRRRVHQTMEQFTLESLANYTKTKGKEFFSDRSFFLKDDKNYDILDIRCYELDTTEDSQGRGPTNTEAVLIRKNDYIRELTNGNDLPLLNNEPILWERNNTIDEIPIDMDFELDIDDVVSAKGSETPVSHTSNVEFPNFNFERDDNHFTPLILEETPRKLGQSFRSSQSNFGEEQRNHNVALSQNENETNVPRQSIPQKRIKITKRVDDTVVQVIKADVRISLVTETLRAFHDDYPQIMQDAQEATRGTKRKRESWESYVSSEGDTRALLNIWRKILPPSGSHTLALGRINPTEEGRNGNPFAISGSTMSSVRSTEVGRRAEGRDFIGNLFQPNNNSNTTGDDSNLIDFGQREDDILGLAQHDHELSGYDQNTGRTGDFLSLNLELPPSSIGRSANRSSTNTSGISEEPDVVSALTRFQPAPHISQTNGSRGSEHASVGSYSYSYERATTSETSAAISEQTRKFYDYMKEKALFDGELLEGEGAYSRKLNFESVVPSKKTRSTANGVTSVNRRVVSGAFFTLLTLASKDMIQLSLQTPEKDRIYPVLTANQGDDIDILI